MTIDYMTGWNHKLAPTATGSGATDYGDLTATLSGGAVLAVDTNTINVRHPGGSVLHISTVNTTNGWGRRTSTSSNSWCGVVYAMFVSLPTTDCAIFTQEIDGVNVCGVAYDVATGQCKLVQNTFAGATFAVAGTPGGPVLQTGVWYRFEISTNSSANPWVVNGLVAIGDGVGTDLASISPALTAISAQQRTILMTDSSSMPFDVYFADLATSATNGDYPIGPISISGYKPNRVGTHNLDASPSQYFFERVIFTDNALTSTDTSTYKDLHLYKASEEYTAIKIGTTVGAANTPSFRSAGTWAFTANNVPTGPTLSPGAPAGVQVGDLLVLISESRSNSATASTPSGWSGPFSGFPARSGTASGGTIYIWYRVADGTSTDTPTVTWSGLTSGTSGDATGAGILCYINGGVQEGSSANAQDLSAQTTTTTIPGVTTINDKDIVLNVAMKLLESSGETATVTTYTERADNSTTSGTGHIVHVSDLVKTPAGASGSGTITWSATGSARAFTVTLIIKPTNAVVEPDSSWYTEYGFSGESGFAPAPIAVRALVTQSQTSNTASSNWIAKLFDALDGSNTEDISNVTLTSSAFVHTGKVFMNRPNSSNPWTIDSLNAIRLRFGNTATADGNPQLWGAMLEVAYLSPVIIPQPQPPTPIIPKLEKLSKSSLHLLDNLNTFATPVVQFGTQYTDAATVSSVTAVTSVESADYVDSATVSSVTTPSTADEQYPISPPEILGILVSLTLKRSGRPLTLHSNILIPDVQGPVQYIDSATISSVTSVQSSENTDFLDTSGTIQGTSSITSVESADYVDSATVTSVTSIDSVEVFTPNFYPPKPLLMKLVNRKAHLLDNLVPQPDSLVTGIGYVDSATVSGVTSVQSSENTDFLDTAGTVQGTSSVSSTELANYSDSNTVPGVTTPSSTDTADYVDSGTVSGVTSLSAVELANYVDAATAVGVTSVTSVDTADYVDSATVSSITSILSVEIFSAAPAIPHPLLIKLDKATRPRLLTPVLSQTPTTAVDYVDSATVSSVTSIQSADSADFLDTAGNVVGVSTVTSTESSDYVDSSTISSTTSLTYTESTDYTDSTTVLGVTTPSSVDTADYVDSAIVAGVTTITGIDVLVGASGYTQPLLIKLASRHGKARFLFHKPVADRIPTQYVDSAVISSTTSITSSDLANDVDSNTCAGTTTPISVDVYNAVDSSTVPGVTTVSTSDIYGHIDSDTCSSNTTVSSVEFANYVDGATINSTTNVSAVEQIFRGNEDFATVTSKTYVISYEIGALVRFALTATLVGRRWTVTNYDSHWSIVKATRRWLASLL